MSDDVNFDNEDNSGEPQMEGFVLAPPGWYVSMIVGAEKKETKDKSGSYLNLQIQIVEGEYKGTTWWHMIHLWNASEKAKKIAKGQLASYRNAVGKTHISNSKELLNIPFRVSVGIQKGDQGYKDKNYTKDAEAMVQKKVVGVPAVSNVKQTTIEEDEVPSFG